MKRAALLLLVAACGSSPEGDPRSGDDAGADVVLPDGGTAGGGDADASSPGPVVRDAHPRIYPELGRLEQLLAANDEAAVRFKAMVDRAVGGASVYDYKAWFSALVFRLTKDARYATDAIRRVDAHVTAEEQRIARGERAEVAGDSYLEVGPTIGDLAIVYDWCHASLTDAQRARWIKYANQAVWNVWHHQEARWGTTSFPWTGWSVNNPSNNYYYSFLRATMLTGLATKGESDQAETFLQTFRQEKIEKQLVPTFARDLTGGGSREGTGYGVAMGELFRLYDLWEASTGERLAERTSHARDSMAYLVHATMPTLDRLAPIGDHARDSTAALFDYHRAYMLALAWLHRGTPLAEVGHAYLASSSVPRMEQQFNYINDFLFRDPGAKPRALDTLSTTYHATGVGHIFMRSSWAKNATFVGFNAGAYTESHAHRDQLSFLFFKNEHLAYDPNVSSSSGLRQEEEAHNLVRLLRNGQTVRQREGTSSRLLALSDDAQMTYVAADAAPTMTGVNRLVREMIFLKPDVLVVFDRVDAPGAAAVWQMSAPVQPTVNGASFRVQGTTSRLDVRRVYPATANTTVRAWSSIDGDYRGGYRVDVEGSGPFLHVLAADGAVTSVTSADPRGATIVLADGRTVTVQFNADQGGTLAMPGRSGALPNTVATIPVFR